MDQKENKEPFFFKRIILFIKSKRFRIHFIISLVIGFLIIWFAFKSLGTYTHHGETMTVPDFSSVKMAELDKFISGKQLRYQIIDSVYDSKTKAGIVIRQDPGKNSSVKQNRIIYLTVSSKIPPLVKMPKLVDASMRQALALLESYGLKAGAREYRPDPCVNCVLAQMIKGKKIEAGEMIPKGSIVDLVLGQGQDGEKINIPCLIGLNHKEALAKIAQSGFSEGSLVCTDCKTSAEKENAKVYKQTPACSSEMVKPGSAIDLYTSLKPVTSSNEE